MSTRGFGLALAGLMAALFLIGFNYAASALSCGRDTSYCAESRQKDGIYPGRLLTITREPAGNVRFSVSFESRSGSEPVAFTTERDGSFCIRWARESVPPSIRQAGLVLEDSEIAQDRRLTTFLTEEDLGDELPADCEEGGAGIPWNRADDLRSSWQFALMIGLAAAAGLLMLIAVLRHERESSARVAQTGAAVLLAAIAASLAGWIG